MFIFLLLFIFPFFFSNVQDKHTYKTHTDMHKDI